MTQKYLVVFCAQVFIIPVLLNVHVLKLPQLPFDKTHHKENHILGIKDVVFKCA